MKIVPISDIGEDAWRAVPDAVLLEYPLAASLLTLLLELMLRDLHIVGTVKSVVSRLLDLLIFYIKPFK